MDKPLVSVIMPSYNAEKYLSRSIESIINQTYDNWEFLIVDDGSVDRSIEICKEYEKSDSRIKLICNQHGGTAIARNTALDVAKGDYIAFLDADDAYHPVYLEYMVDEVVSSGNMIALCATVRGTDATEFFETSRKSDFKIISKEEAFRKMYQGNWPDMIAPYTKLYAKELFEKVRFPSGMYFEDAATMNLAIYYSNSVSVTDQDLYFYNITPNSSSVTKKSVELLDREKALRSHWEFFFKEKRDDLALLNIPFYLVELITIYYRMEKSDKPETKKVIRHQFNEVYRKYYNKVEFTDEQKNLILMFRHPYMYDIGNMISEDGIFKTMIGFIKRKIDRIR